jgi:NodT family efflux transporter outer membrane factor (OMF) lipoprotein
VSRRALSAALAALPLLAGCAVGPRYAAPATPGSAAGPFVSAAPAISSADAPPPTWWRLYQDPVLDRLVTEALAANRDIEAAVGNVLQARAIVSEARAGRYPSTSVSAGAAYGRRASGAAKAETGFIFDAEVGAAYEVDLFGRVSRTLEAARANADAAQAAADVLRVSVAAQTASAYADACGLAAQAEVARRSLQVASETAEITVRRRDAGAASDFDVARARALVEQTGAEIPALEGQRRAALFALAVLTGRPPAELPADAGQCRAPPRIATPLPVGDGASLLRRRPDVRQAERRLAAAVAEIGVRTAELYPSVTLGGSLSSAASSLGRLGSSRSVSFSLGPLISWTFPNQMAARARVAQARAGASAALAGFDAAVLRALGETEQTLSVYGADLDRRAGLLAARDQNAEAFRLAQVRQQGGAISFLELLTAQSSLVGSEAALAAADTQIAADQIAVFRALGGGWEAAPEVTPRAFPS